MDQTMLRSKLIGVSAVIKLKSKGRTSHWRTRSRVIGPSPAMLPIAQTACSATSGRGETSNCFRLGRAPSCTTAWVCSDVPDAMLVKAQHASNCSEGLYKRKI